MRFAPAMRPAAVLIPLVLRDEGLTVLLTERAAHLPQHPGQISFPGGRIDPNDANPEAAALRETEEEVGLDRRHIRLIGRLPLQATGTGYVITPVAGFVDPPFSLTLAAEEVADAFEVPLAHIVDAANHQTREIEREGQRLKVWVLPYEKRNIWGATAAILVGLARRLALS